MKILLAGASGYLGQNLGRSLRLAGHEVTALSRRPDHLEWVDRTALWDGVTLGEWVGELETADALINLSGRSIACKWTEQNRKEIWDSRVGTTQLLAEACQFVSVPPRVWINASAIGIYPPNLDEPLDERAAPATGFLGELGVAWERAIFEPHLQGCRRVALRTSVVLGQGGGAFDVFVRLTRRFLGGSAGSGRQWMSWIHVGDWVRLVQWLLECDLDGPINATAPEPVRNRDFMAAMRKAYSRPWCPPAPAFAIRLFGKIFGPEPSLVLDGFRVVPNRAVDAGFDFRYRTLEESLGELLLKGENEPP